MYLDSFAIIIIILIILRIFAQQPNCQYFTVRSGRVDSNINFLATLPKILILESHFDFSLLLPITTMQGFFFFITLVISSATSTPSITRGIAWTPLHFTWEMCFSSFWYSSSYVLFLFYSVAFFTLLCSAAIHSDISEISRNRGITLTTIMLMLLARYFYCIIECRIGHCMSIMWY